MNDEEKGILHRVKLYVGKTLVNVAPDLLEEPAKALMEEWLDVDLDRHAECDTLKCGCDDDEIIDDEELALVATYRVYMFVTTAGIINILAPTKEQAEAQLKSMLDDVETRYGNKIELGVMYEGGRVHIVVDTMGLLHTSIDAKDIYEASITPFEE